MSRAGSPAASASTAASSTAIVAGDEEAAYARMRDHLLTVREASAAFVTGRFELELI